MLLTTIVQDLKHANQKSKNPRLNRMVQGLLFGMVERGMDEAPTVLKRADAELKGRTEALWAVRIAADMWRRRIWSDARTMALLALACTHPHPKVQASAVRFFLGDLHAAESAAADSDDDENTPGEAPDVGRITHQRKVGKKTRAVERRLKLAQAQARRRRKETAAKAVEREDQETGNMAAIHLLHDPQAFAESLFENLRRGDKRHSLEMKVRILQLLSRVISTHRLCVLSFYSYVARYLAPHQMHITLILVALAQSVHDQTPTDVLTPAIRKIAYAFVHPGVGAEVVAAGINTIREVCRRQPWCMEVDLLEDLVEYRKSKDKGVSAASRGLMQLYREVNPAMLRRAERGKSGAMALAEGRAPAQYGVDRREVHGIPGLDLLEKHLQERGDDGEEGVGEHDDWDGWELESASDSDSSGGWINVSDDENDFVEVDKSGLSDEDEAKASQADDKPVDTRPMSERVREARHRRRQERVARAAVPDGDEDDADDGAAPVPVPTEPESISQLATTKVRTCMRATYTDPHAGRLCQTQRTAAAAGGRGSQGDWRRRCRGAPRAGCLAAPAEALGRRRGA